MNPGAEKEPPVVAVPAQPERARVVRSVARAKPAVRRIVIVWLPLPANRNSAHKPPTRAGEIARPEGQFSIGRRGHARPILVGPLHSTHIHRGERCRSLPLASTRFLTSSSVSIP